MDSIIPLLQVLGGLTILVVGGETLVRGAVGLANAIGVPPLIIGLTIVSFGTSAPEMVISVQAVLEHHPDIALGNIIGSNIANILLVLGAATLLYPIQVDSKLLKRDAPLILVVSILMIVFCQDGLFSRIEAGIFLLIVAVYTWHIFRIARSGEEDELLEELEEEVAITMPLWKAGLFIVFGLVCLVAGSDVLVEGAVELARIAGISEAVIGLTVLAIGSSAPELITAIVAAMRKHGDIALGNVIGSNLFNMTAIGGVAGMVAPMAVAPRFITHDLWLMTGTTAVLILFMYTGRRVIRLEGATLLAGYIAYTVWLYLDSLPRNS